MELDARAASRRWSSLGLLAAGLILIVARDPSLFTDPRLRAEEGALFYSRAHHGVGLWDRTWLDVGYADAIPVLAAWTSAHVLPLESVPYGMLAFALASLLLPLALLAGSRAPLFADRPRTWLAALTVLAIAANEETWLSTLGSKFHWALVPIILGLEAARDQSSARPPWGRCALAALAGFVSVLCAFLLPAFVLPAWRRRDRNLGWLTASLGLGVAVQLGIAFGLSPSDEALDGLSAASRLHWQAWSHWPASALFEGLLPNLVGRAWAHEILRLGEAAGRQHALWAGAARLIALAVWMGLLSLGGRGESARFLRLAYLGLVLGVTLFGLGNHPHALGMHLASRYAMVPAILFAWMLLSTTPRPRSLAAGLSAVLVLAVLTTGLLGSLERPVEPRDRPSWRTEVARFRADPTYPIRIVPTPWTLRLGPGFDRQAHVEPRLLAGTPSALELTATTPRLGSAVRLSVRGASPRARGFLLAQPAAPVSVRSPEEFPGLRTVLPLALDEGIRIEFTANSTGEWSTDVPLQAGDLFEGLDWTVQAVQIEPRLLVSDGIYLRLGR